MNPHDKPRYLDYETPRYRRSDFCRYLRFITSIMCWSCTVYAALIAFAVILFRRSILISTNPYPLDWRDITKTVSFCVFIGVLFSICALLLKAKKPRK